ncbi:AN1-type zinc finger protein 6-like [Actinia tenebrosa]|uniref:AN1-type zinc finger protein 6-like n=1 Tax=Actinia tenebrosa TaxID=6105 RepID=A0A6P8ICQ4_ACTTE|nr:AN1-type zinc finger protein 6-like [Actinia tenebrosa]XP_031562816.1 AN1-type zinc finger protein 6-like [Actinia tenebrosa]
MENETNQPALCRNGCGFYGSPSNEGMCSKCFKDVLRRKQSSPTATPSSSSTIPASVEGSSSTTSMDGAVAMAASLSSSSSMLSSIPCTSIDNKTIDDRQPKVVDIEAGPSEDPKDKSKTKRNRCFTCRKKVGLTGFECRCGNVFCGLHRYSDKHGCTFDYKAEGRAKITKDNPVILAEKIQKI